MKSLTLKWQAKGQDYTYQIYEKQPSKKPGYIQIGRDAQQCDIFLEHPTVSRLHVEIFFNSQHQNFYIRNFSKTTPAKINGNPLETEEIELTENTIIDLGQQQLQVLMMPKINIPNTIILPKSSQSSPEKTPKNNKSPLPTQPNPVYGLECPKCHNISPLENIKLVCPWCGTSLATAASVLLPKG